MILGLGTDLVAVERIGAALDRHGDRFAQRILTPDEQALCARRLDRTSCVAARFAAKEAAAKALGTGFSQGVRPGHLEVVREAGPPRLRLHAAAFEVAVALGVDRAHLSLSDEPGFALATVVLEGGGARG